jgi:anti-sigma factor RsiW
MTTDHPPFERLSELADAALPAGEAAAIERHLTGCATCRGELARLRALLGRTATLPSSIDPPSGAWEALRDKLRPQSRPVARSSRPWVREWGLRAAAAVLLVAGSSTVTVLVLRSRTAQQVAAVAQSPVATPVAVPAAVRAVERSYVGVVDELTSTLRAERGALAPETIATLERTLRVIDDAIAEARAALAADPSNAALLDILSANYEQKVQLLRRASELPART